MFCTDKMPLEAAKISLVEGRYKITEVQKRKLKDLEDRLNIPASTLVRMALDCFLPKVVNAGYTENGIKTGYLNGRY